MSFLSNTTNQFQIDSFQTLLKFATCNNKLNTFLKIFSGTSLIININWIIFMFWYNFFLKYIFLLFEMQDYYKLCFCVQLYATKISFSIGYIVISHLIFLVTYSMLNKILSILILDNFFSANGNVRYIVS